MRESARTDLREPQGSNPLGPPGPELYWLWETPLQRLRRAIGVSSSFPLNSSFQDFLY